MTHAAPLARKVLLDVLKLRAERRKTPQFYLMDSGISMEANHGKPRQASATACVKRLSRSGTRTSASAFSSIAMPCICIASVSAPSHRATTTVLPARAWPPLTNQRDRPRQRSRQVPTRSARAAVCSSPVPLLAPRRAVRTGRRAGAAVRCCGPVRAGGLRLCRSGRPGSWRNGSGSRSGAA